MAGGVLGLAAAASLLNLLPGAAVQARFTQLPFYYHLVMGGFAFGIVFMATDPVSAAATNAGKWIYGFLIGVLTVADPRGQPGLSRGRHAGHPVHERHGAR